MDVNGEIQHFDKFEMKSKIKFFNDYNQKGKYGKNCLLIIKIELFYL